MESFYASTPVHLVKPLRLYASSLEGASHASTPLRFFPWRGPPCLHASTPLRLFPQNGLGMPLRLYASSLEGAVTPLRLYASSHKCVRHASTPLRLYASSSDLALRRFYASTPLPPAARKVFAVLPRVACLCPPRIRTFPCGWSAMISFEDA